MTHPGPSSARGLLGRPGPPLSVVPVMQTVSLPRARGTPVTDRGSTWDSVAGPAAQGPGSNRRSLGTRNAPHHPPEWGRGLGAAKLDVGRMDTGLASLLCFGFYFLPDCCVAFFLRQRAEGEAVGEGAVGPRGAILPSSGTPWRTREHHAAARLPRVRRPRSDVGVPGGTGDGPSVRLSTQRTRGAGIPNPYPPWATLEVPEMGSATERQARGPVAPAHGKPLLSTHPGGRHVGAGPEGWEAARSGKENPAGPGRQASGLRGGGDPGTRGPIPKELEQDGSGGPRALQTPPTANRKAGGLLPLLVGTEAGDPDVPLPASGDQV